MHLQSSNELISNGVHIVNNFYRFIIAVMIICLAAVESSAQPDGYAYGLEHSNDGGGFRFWNLNLETGDVSEIGRTGTSVLGSHGMIDSWNNVFCYYTREGGNQGFDMVGVDLLTGDERYRVTLETGTPTGTFFNPTNGLFYCMTRDGLGAYLTSIDIAGGVVTTLELLPLGPQSQCGGMLDYTRGQYHFASAEERAYVLDVNTGEIVDRYSIDLMLMAGRFDPVSGNFYGFGGVNNRDFLMFDPVAKNRTLIKKDVAEEMVNVCVGGIDVDRRLFAFQTGLHEIRIIDLEGNLVRTVSDPTPGMKFHWNVYTPGSVGGTLARVSGRVVSDSDADCVAAESEDFLSGWKLLVTPGDLKLRTNREGEFVAYLPEGDFNIKPVGTDLWVGACLPSGLDVTVNSDLDPVEHVDFPMEAQSLVESLEVSITSSAAMVGRQILYYINIHNNGTVPYTGIVQFKHDPVLTDFASIPPATEYDAPEAEWYIEDLPIGATRTIVVKLQVPRDESLMGKEVCASVKVKKNGGNDLLNKHKSDETCDEITAPKDPNDISVTPRGFGGRGIVQAEDSTLTYTIRFQNVGSAAARDVVILDTLDSDLDVSTIYFGASSHDYYVNILEGNILEFRFEGIELPGKDVDEEGSQGVVKYAVNVNRFLPVDTEIKNRAAIYFDFNKPVITNTVLNTIGQTATGVGALVNFDPLEVRQVGNNIFAVDRNDSSESHLTVYSILGNKILEQTIRSEEQVKIDLSAQPTGCYLLSVHSDDAHSRAVVEVIH